MGYDTFVFGTFLIQPDVPEKEWPYENLKEGQGCLEFVFVPGSEDAVLNDQGEIVIVGQPGHINADCRYEENIRGYSTFEDTEIEVIDVANWCQGHGVRMNGEVRGKGEDELDFWRIRVVDNAVFSETPKLVWPNGDEEPAR